MLTLTDTASTVVKEIVSRSGAPETGGLRIDADSPQSTDFQVTIVPGPFDHDQVVTQDGAHVYLGHSADEALTDKTLDARVDEEGRVAFDVLPQTIS
ncbi:Fe-S cluster assembly protein HesB [Agromyces sp. CFH 90414]|uniref:Fe-S cluster assembly protein HesB n=1 Tax=Agromyces agglutinans TaxID=2662258 RepID=A0A6I2FA08_9MICO|nr:Fe-S cluster assembly protein HesB [Agromyces agglutinans]MRG59550.1 Fe-S cluster assembly protein HesB [Agromyces agglutinans]